MFNDEWGGISDILVLMELDVVNVALTSTALALRVAINRYRGPYVAGIVFICQDISTLITFFNRNFRVHHD